MSKSNGRSGLAFGISAAAMTVAMMAATPAYAQVTSTIRGQVEGASPGTVVTVTDTNTGRSVTTTVQADGSYVIVGLRPSVYRVETEGRPAEEVVLPVGEVITFDLMAAEEGAEIVVRGAQDRPEVRSATIGTSVSQAQIENLPQNDRNFLNFAALAPGVTVSAGADKKIQAGGVSADNINVFIDGTSHKNQVGFNGVAGQNFSQGNPFPQSAVQEFRVETQNFKAEYEQAGSAIITAITKTGGQEFHGGAFGEFMPKAWFGRPYYDRPGNANNVNGTNEKPDYKRYQFGADLGGPIVPGVLHFFGAYEGTRQSNPTIVVNVPPGIPGVPGEPSVANEFSQNLYFGKLTLFATDADTFHASYFRRDESDVRDYGGNALREHGRDIGTSTENYQLEWNHRADTWFNELSFSYFKSFTGTPTLTVGPEIKLTDGINGGDQLFLGANAFQQANDQKAYTVKESFTYTGWDGHVVKIGARVSQTELTRIEDAFANGSYSFDAMSYSGFDSSTPWRATISILPATPMTADNTQVGLFIQDDWTIDDHLTLNLGLRWDYESNNFNNDFVTPAKVATALRNYQPWQAAGIDPEDYITDGTEREPFKGAFQPRIGISYDVNGDRDLVFFAGAGRYYDRNIFYTASLETLFNTIRSDVNVNFCNTVNTTDCTPWNPAYRDPQALRDAVATGGLSGDIWVLNDDNPPPYTDQFTVGVRKQLGQLNVSAAVAHNRSYNGFIFVRGNRMPDGLYTVGGDAWVRDNFPIEGRPAGYTGRLNIGSNEGETRYTALYLTVDKPFTEESGWGVTGALTISDAKSNQGMTFGEAQMYNAGSQDAFGWQRTRGLERWRFVGTGIVNLPWDIKGSTTVTLASGPTFGNVDFGRTPPANCGGCFYYNDGGVFDPPYFVAYSTVDLRLAKTFRMPWGHDLTIDAEAFNIFDSINRNYSTWGAGSGSNPPLVENGTVGNARSFQMGVKYRF